MSLTWIVFVTGCKGQYSCCFVRRCFQNLFNKAHSILVPFPSSFLSLRVVSVHVVHPYISFDATAAWERLHFILSSRSDFHMTDSLSIAVHAFASHEAMSFSVDEALVRFVNLSTSFTWQTFIMEMSPLWWKHMYSVFSALTWTRMPPASRFRLHNRDSSWAVIFAWSAMSLA